MTPNGPRTVIPIVFAAHDQAEATKRAANAQKDRKDFASTYETMLLETHMNPDGVSADGKTLRVRGWFCIRQFIYDFQKSSGEVAKSWRRLTRSREAGRDFGLDLKTMAFTVSTRRLCCSTKLSN